MYSTVLYYTVTRVSLSPDTGYLVSSGQDGEVNFWDVKVTPSFIMLLYTEPSHLIL